MPWLRSSHWVCCRLCAELTPFSPEAQPCPCTGPCVLDLPSRPPVPRCVNTACIPSLSFRPPGSDLPLSLTPGNHAALQPPLPSRACVYFPCSGTSDRSVPGRGGCYFGVSGLSGLAPSLPPRALFPVCPAAARAWAMRQGSSPFTAPPCPQSLERGSNPASTSQSPQLPSS